MVNIKINKVFAKYLNCYMRKIDLPKLDFSDFLPGNIQKIRVETNK